MNAAVALLRQPFAVPALAFIVVSLPLILGLAPPNRFYGVRTAKTMADPVVWRKVNRVAGALLALSGAVYLLFAASAPAADGRDFGRWARHLAAFAAPLILALAGARVYSRRLP